MSDNIFVKMEIPSYHEYLTLVLSGLKFNS